MKDFPTDPVAVTLADGKEYHLRFNFSAVRKIKNEFGKTLDELTKCPREDLLLFALPLGIVEGVTAEALENDLLLGPMTPYVFSQFVTSFFPKGESDAWLALMAETERRLVAMSNDPAKAIADAEKMTKKAAE